MRIDYIECEEIYYTALMGSGEEMNRLIKRLWKNPYYDFSFTEKPWCMPNRLYMLDITYNDSTSRYDVALAGQETVFVILKSTNVKITSTVSFSYGEETL